jgi:hypothetical protein
MGEATYVIEIEIHRNMHKGVLGLCGVNRTVRCID